MSADASEREWQEQVEAAELERERLGPLAAEKAKAYEGLTLEQLYARWAEVMRSQSGWESYDDDFKADVMAIYQAIGFKTGKRVEVLRAGGFEYGEPMQ